IQDLRHATRHEIEASAGGNRVAALAGAGAYLRLFATTVAGGLLAKAALAADDTDAGRGAFAKAAFFAQTVLPETASLLSAVTGAGRALEDGAAALLGGD
ncbi:MAG: acyl-CoA dehydrogenase C-terminal domain-containing protein, partial [Rhizobiales bacterium]|nr:acyl-CoA dehydrogenase C-terminal domain-containing protein [Hyphomicrobiales bacterium]